MGLSRLFNRPNNRSANTASPHSTAAASTAAAGKPRKPTEWEQHLGLRDDGVSRFKKYKHPRVPVLVDILSMNRHADGPGIELLESRYLTRLPGVVQDDYGNYFVTIGDNPTVLWTSHCDTVSDDPVSIRHPICYNAAKDILFRRDGNILGADDGTGIWLMLEMIEAGVPGLYAFFQDEETGRRGSKWSATKEPERYKGINHCISFDRKGFEDIVGTQNGNQVCCSSEFQQALANLIRGGSHNILPRTKAFGSFTDSASFMDMIPECTNLCVGYDDQHTPLETQHVGFAMTMRNFLVNHGAKIASLPAKRDPTPSPAPSYNPYNPNWGYGGIGGFEDMAEPSMNDTVMASDMALGRSEYYALIEGDAVELCEVFPEATASLLDMLGFDTDALAEYITDTYLGMDNIRNADT